MNFSKRVLFQSGVALLTMSTIGGVAAPSVAGVAHADENSAISTDGQSVLTDDNDVINNINDGNTINQEIDKEIQVRQIPAEKQAIAREQMRDFFDPDNSHYMDSSSLTAWSNPNDESVNPVYGTMLASHGLISDNVLGSALNVAIGAAVGGVAGGVGMLIKKKGKQFVLKLLRSRVKATMAAMGIGASAYLINKAIEFALDLTSPGNKIAEFLDNHDKKPDNGYIEWS